MASPGYIVIRSYPPIRLIVIFGILGLVLATLLTQNLKILAFYSLFNVVVVSAVNGNLLRARLSSPRARTIPDYLSVHVAVGLGVCLLNLIVSGGIGVFGGLPLASLLLWLWSFSLLGLIGGYAMPAVALAYPKVGLISVAAAGGAFALSAFGPIGVVTERLGWPAQLLLFMVNAPVTILFVRRVFQLNEEAFEYIRTDPRETAQRVYQKNPRQRTARLDSIQPVLPSDLRSRLRHLELGLFPTRPSFLSILGALTALSLVLRIVTQNSTRPTRNILLGGVIGYFIGSLFVARSSVRRFLMLPLSRRELVAKAGGTMLLWGLRVWLAGAIAFVIAHWRIPPAELLLTTLAFQLPLFGILTLVMSVRRPWRSGTLLLLTPAVAFGLLGVWILVAPVQVRIAVFMISGVALIGLSYYSWCNAELE